jgi:phosphoribosylformylglycinamidine synthase
MTQRAGNFNASKCRAKVVKEIFSKPRNAEHCSAGKMRTGSSRAMLGAPRGKIFRLASGSFFPQNLFRAHMKAKIIITPKKAVVDPQGITVLKALEHMGHRGIKAVHVGKYLEIELDATENEAARKSLDEAAHKFLSNPVIEDYRLEIE